MGEINTMSQFDGQVVMVTGGASGIGAATCEAFVREGAQVVVATRNPERGEAFTRSLGKNAAFMRLDVTKEDQWGACMDAIADRYSRFDVLVNSAGTSLRTNIENTGLDGWKSVIDTNMTGVFLGCKYAVSTMKVLQSPGAIINIGSLGSLIGSEDSLPYCTSKAGMHIVTKSVARYCALEKLGIRCNSVLPTATDTPMMHRQGSAMGDAERIAKIMAERIPMGRMVEPAEVADVVLFLASPKAAMVTGVGIPVDGGVMTAYQG